jgi:hypothetical protein
MARQENKAAAPQPGAQAGAGQAQPEKPADGTVTSPAADPKAATDQKQPEIKPPDEKSKERTGAGTAQSAPQVPTIGRIVHVRDCSNGQGADGIAPAIVNRVWNDKTINVTVWPDNAPAYHMSRIRQSSPGTLRENEWQWPTR